MLIFIDAIFNTVLTPTAESTLALTRSDMQKAVSVFVQMGNAVPTDTNDLAAVNRAIDSGLRRVYWPSQVLGEPWAHEWSWMRPTFTFTTSADFAAYQLPSTFGGIEGDITFAEGQAFRVITVRGEDFIRRQQQSNVGSGIPKYAAVRALDSGLSGQRRELVLWPTPGTEYELTFRYNINPNALAAANDYPLGGPALAETILQSCRAAADQIINDNVGAEHALFIELLKASVSLDRRMLAPERLGYAHDPRMFRERFFPWVETNVLPGFVVNDITVM